MFEIAVRICKFYDILSDIGICLERKEKEVFKEDVCYPAQKKINGAIGVTMKKYL